MLLLAQISIGVGLLLLGALVGMLVRTSRVVDRLWEIHNVRGRDGVPVWYVRESLEDQIGNLAHSIDKLGGAVEHVCSTSQGTQNLVLRLLDREERDRAGTRKPAPEPAT